MSSEIPRPSSPSKTSGWRSSQVYTMAVVCLGAGLAVGYLGRGPQGTTPDKVAAAPLNPHAAMLASDQPPTLEQMKQMGDKAAAPHLEKIKSDPKNFAALNNAGKVYRATHQFEEAANYYKKALEIQPENAAVRTDLASCLYYTGDVDGALAQLDKALTYDPKFYGALLNAGIIKLQAKKDLDGAITSWRKIVKSDSDPQHKEMAEQLIAQAKQKNTKVSDEAK